MLRRVGLGLAVGAVLHSTAGAQVRDTTRTKKDTVRSPADSVTGKGQPVKRDTSTAVRVAVPARADSMLKRDSLVLRDSIRTATPLAAEDTLKAPLARVEAPVLADPTGSFVWDRRDVFATGALTAQELLERIPGATTFRSGWIGQPMLASFMGDPGRVRVFLDGLELNDPDPRSGGLWDLSQIPIWALDDIRVERGASEIRIYMRSWRVERTTPFTRTDIYTGDQGTNLYRGLFGRRYRHGESIQFAGQQFGTSPGGSENSDQLGVLARVGWANPRWSVDAMLLRTDRDRGRTFSELAADTIPHIASTRSEAYVRLGWGNSDRGWWAQTLANTSRFSYGGSGSATTPAADSTDTLVFRAQYVVTGGYSRGPWRASYTQRYIVGNSRHLATPAARASFDTRLLTVSLFAEGRAADSTRRFEASAVVRPLSFVFLSGAVGKQQPREAPDSLPAPSFLRGEVGVRLGDLWFSGGAVHRDAILLDAAKLLRTESRAVAEPELNGLTAVVRGRLWKSVYLDAVGTRWADTAGLFRPQWQTRTELYLSTSMPDRFPTGNFHVLLSLAHEYRSSTVWTQGNDLFDLNGYRTLATHLQFRIVNAEVFWTLRNVLGERYAQVPGYFLPRATNIYGVRWEFWN